MASPSSRLPSGPAALATLAAAVVVLALGIVGSMTLSGPTSSTRRGPSAHGIPTSEPPGPTTTTIPTAPSTSAPSTSAPSTSAPSPTSPSPASGLAASGSPAPASAMAVTGGTYQLWPAGAILAGTLMLRRHWRRRH